MSKNIDETTRILTHTRIRTILWYEISFDNTKQYLFSESNRIDVAFFCKLKDFKVIHSTKWFCVLCSTMSTFQPLSHKTKDTNTASCIHFEKEIVVCHLRRPWWWCWYGVKSNFPVRSSSDYYGGDGAVAGETWTPKLISSCSFSLSLFHCVSYLVSIVRFLSMPLTRCRYFSKWFIALLLSQSHIKAVQRQWRMWEMESRCEWMMRYEACTWNWIKPMYVRWQYAHTIYRKHSLYSGSN